MRLRLICSVCIHGEQEALFQQIRVTIVPENRKLKDAGHGSPTADVKLAKLSKPWIKMSIHQLANTFIMTRK